MQNIKNLKVYLESKILASNNVVIVPHMGIDFDAIASAIGLSQIAKKLKKPSCIVVDDPVYKIDSGVQTIIEEAKKDFLIVTREKYLQSSNPNDLFILTDVNKEYLIALKEEIKGNVVIIDHHNPDDKTVKSDYSLIDSTYSSASEILVQLMCQFKIKPTPEVANYLLAGIYLDTNKLTKNVNPETMKIVAKLLEYGANMNYVTDLFTEDFISDRRVQDLVSKAKITTYSIAIALADSDCEYTKEELAKVADYLLKYRVDAAFSIGNIGENVIAISARSKEKVNVSYIMKQLNGGGHPYSAATRLTDCSIEEAGKRLQKIIEPIYYIEKA